MIFINSSPKNALKIFQPFLPIFIPVGIAYLVAACRGQGIEADFIDEQVDEDVPARVAALLEGREKPYIFGFSVLTAAVRQALAVSRELKALYPDSVIVFGGIHPTAMPEEMLANEQVDVVVRGEGEQVMVDLYKAIKSGESLEKIRGISYRKDGAVVHNPMPDTAVDLDRLPAFPYDLFQAKNYDMGFIISSRGCPYNCIFCSNRISTGKRYRFNRQEYIIETLERLHDEYGQTFVLFLDDNFLVNKARTYKLLEEIRNRGLHEKMSFSFQARGDNVDRELLEALYASGFKSIFFGMETANEDLMRLVKKGETVAQCVEAVKMAKDVGFHVSATFIFGLPTESPKDRRDAVLLAKRLGLDQVRFNNATPYPGTELYAMAKEAGHLHVKGVYDNFLSVGTFIESPFDPIPFSYVADGVTEQVLRNDILFAYLAFYWDFAKLKEIILRPKQGVGWFNAGEGLLGLIRKLPALALLFSLMGIKFSRMTFDILRGKNTSMSRRDLLAALLGRFGRNQDD